ncbi:MAG: 1-acyl-sn-glycerol-3-phosphate acyltransferase [Deltaproteobacteria bacterium]|nr:1-acyl-sn-glycerol-3-phosphate acyltransferase [Deltaproteobacteria bacterium]
MVRAGEGAYARAMLDLNRLEKLRLHTKPITQRLIAQLVLRPNFGLARTRITLEGVDNIPRDRGVYFAMNHTDRYNYWPFQYQLYRHGGLRYTATWVKGKYYENRLMGAFMDATNNIPLPSRGYVITTEFRKLHGRVPTADEYRALRDLVDEGATLDPAAVPGGPAVAALVGRDGPIEGFPARFERLFDAMMGHVTRLTRQALDELDLNLLVFPQGTRSLRLSRGHTGLMQMAQHTGHAIVPVGCSGSDKAYPGGSPFAKKAHIVYRVGAPLSLDGPELGPHRVREPYTPFTRGAARFEDRFRAATDVVMQHIDRLVDPAYRFADDAESDGVVDVNRFV